MLLVLLAGWSLGCQPSDPGTRAVHRSLSGFRCLQPRFSTSDTFKPCTSSEALIPETRCGACPDAGRLEQLGKALRRLRKETAAELTSDRLQAVALGRIMLAPTRPQEIETAITLLDEALDLVDDPVRRAGIFADLAGAELLLAEALQTPLKVAAALEFALAALEIDPDNAAARFNSRLALALLGIDSVAAQQEDPWTAELRRRSSPDRSNARQECPSEISMRRLIDGWAAERTGESRAKLVEATRCWGSVPDRFFPTLLDLLETEPESTALAWTAYRAAEAALYRLEVDGVAEQLRTLRERDPPSPIALAARLLDGIVYYQHNDYPRAVAVLEELADQADAKAFFAVSGEAHRLIALIAHVRGEIGEAFRHLEFAAVAAAQTRSRKLYDGMASLRIELMELAGREDEAWRSVLGVLRALDRENQGYLKLFAVRSAASLARDRGFDRVALVFYDQGVKFAAGLGPVPEATSLRYRGELQADLGRFGSARDDLSAARQLLAEADVAPTIATTLESDLLLLEGRVAADPERRQDALTALVESYRATDYDYRILVAELALARLQRGRGDVDGAIANLEEALDELAEQVVGAGSWDDSSALVAASRSLIDELLALELRYRGPREVRDTLARVFGLRKAVEPEPEELPAGRQRLTVYALPREAIMLLEAGGRLFLERRPIERRRLAELRERLLRQLRNRVAETHWLSSAKALAEVVLAPVSDRIVPGSSLTIVADDVVAGLPFHVLPVTYPATKRAGELLIDRVAVSYATDLRLRNEPPLPTSIVAVGVSEAPPGLPPLPRAIDEARQVAALYPRGRLLLDSDATVDGLLTALDGAEVVHLSSHFIANTRSPLDSYLVLSGEGAPQLSLRQFVAVSTVPRLLYLSGCETGRGLPPAAHGLSSLAQAFAGAGIERTVLTLWPIPDRLAAAVAVSFHRRLISGVPADEALHAAQLEHRSDHPGIWAPLALFW